MNYATMPMQISNILNLYSQQLAATSKSPRLDIELLLGHVLQCSRSFLYVNLEKQLASEQLQNFLRLVSERKSGKSIAYLIGKQEFWSHELFVNESVLIPRPETELLVETALIILKNNPKANILELGTGSGAIALALASERPDWNILATDYCDAALKVAKQNAQRLQLSNINFHLSDWLKSVPSEIKYDAIISNPPYIAENDPELQSSVAKFEPKMALISGKDGLDAIKIIIRESKKYLATNGWLMLEHGYAQKNAVSALLLENNFTQIQTFQDLNGHDRVTIAI